MCSQCVALEDMSPERREVAYARRHVGPYPLRQGDRISWVSLSANLLHVGVISEVMTVNGNINGSQQFFRVGAGRLDSWLPESMIVDPLPPKDPFAFDEWQQRYFPETGAPHLAAPLKSICLLCCEPIEAYEGPDGEVETWFTTGTCGSRCPATLGGTHVPPRRHLDVSANPG